MQTLRRNVGVARFIGTRPRPGEGKKSAKLMLVGEQPGDREDLAGKPFVGPAGHILDRALEEAGILREAVFVTNAVKHFKYEPRGKLRLHKRPNAYEIERCRWWLDLERELLKPEGLVALGATAARSLLGRTVNISKLRGQRLETADGAPLMVTIHPSLLLRLKDKGEEERMFRQFVEDLGMAGAWFGLAHEAEHRRARR